MEWRKISSEDVTQVFVELQSSEAGLSLALAEEKLATIGANKIEEKSFSLLDMLRRRTKSYFLYLLLSASLLSSLLGDYVEAGLILLFIAINIGLEIYQEYHGEKAV
ncbi:MAG: cation-transporting P-type ATPase, partial [Candidatus Moraniibacteriota bacterium]